MRGLFLFLVLFVALSVGACGGPSPNVPRNDAGGRAGAAGSPRSTGKCAAVPDEPAPPVALHEPRVWEPPPKRPGTGNAKLDELRSDEDYVLSAMEVTSDLELDKAEEELLVLARILAGQQGSRWMGASGKPEAASGVIEELRKSGAVLKFKERKWARGTFTLDKAAFFEWYAKKDPDGTKLKHVKTAFVELSAQVNQVASMMRRFMGDQQQATIITIGRAQFMLAARKKYGGKLDAKDLEHIRAALSTQKRVEALNAVAIGLTATFQGAIADNKNPKAIDAIATATVKGLPMGAISVSEGQAKDFVDELPGSVKELKVRYEEWQSKAMGKEDYEKGGKANAKAFLDQLVDADPDSWSKTLATKRKSIRPNTHAATAPRATPSRVAHHRNPSCDDPASSAGSGAKTAATPTAGAAPGDQGLSADISNSMQGIDAARKGNIATALDRAAKVAPAGTIRRSLEGAAAVANGDVKGALGAAIDLVPIPGPLRDGLQFALSFV